MKALPLLLGASLLAAPSYAQCGTPDALEDNDDCGTAVAIPGNSATGLNVEDIDRDFFLVTVPDTERITVDLTFVDANGDIDLYLFDPNIQCDTDVIGSEGFGAGALDYGFSASDNETAMWDNTTGASVDVVIEVRLYSASTSTCNDFDIDVTVAPPPPVPTCATADQFEPNLDCSSASMIGAGTYTGLNVSDGDNDYYAVTVQAGDTVDVTIDFLDDFADVDLYLWDPTIACDTVSVGTGGATGFLDRGFSATDNEDVTWTNASGAPVDIIIEVDMFTGGGCNDYDMTISGAGPGGPGPIGTQFCGVANINSTGVQGICSAIGLRSVAANDVTLVASQLPPGQFGIFVCAQAEVPGVPVADGFLCLGGAIGRFQDFAQIFQVNAMGEGSLVLDLGVIPQPMGDVSVMAGDTWKFQGWHRDSGPAGPTANFTTGVSIDFTN